MLAQRIVHVVRDVLKLTLDGQNLPQQGVGRIAWPHARHVATGNPESKSGSGGVSGCEEASIQPQRIDQSLGARDGVRHFRLPAGRIEASDSWITGLPVVLAGVG